MHFYYQKLSAIEFKFENLINAEIGWIYFSITCVASILNPLLRIEHASAAVKCILLPTVSKYNENYYTLVSSNWSMLKKSRHFEVHSNLNLSIDSTISN